MAMKRAIITVVNSIGPTSMPFNEFVLYRASRDYDEEHSVVVLDQPDSDFISENTERWNHINLKVKYCMGNYFALRDIVFTLIDNYRAKGITPIIHLHHPRSGAAFQLLRLISIRNVPVVFTVHNMVPSFSFVTKLLWYVNYLLANIVVFVGGSSYTVFPAYLRTIKSRNSRIITNGVDIMRVIATETKLRGMNGRARASKKRKSVKIVNIGRLNKQKNQVWLLRLLARLPKNITLTIIGEGSLRTKLEATACRLRVNDRLKLTGLLRREDVFMELMEAELFVSPSLFEGLPIAVLEAMALGKNLVLSNIGPHKEISKYGSSVKVLPLVIDMWAKYIERFLHKSSMERYTIGEKNREIVTMNFTLDRMHKEYTEVYRLLSGCES